MDGSIFCNPESSSAIWRSWWLEHKNRGWLSDLVTNSLWCVYLRLDWGFYIWFISFIIRYWSAWISLFKIFLALLRVNLWVSHSYQSMGVTYTICFHVLLMDTYCSFYILCWIVPVLQILWGRCGKLLWLLLKYMCDHQLKVQKIHMMEDMIPMVLIKA